MSEAVATPPREANGVQQGKQYHARSVSPPVDVFENGDEVLLVADVPGVPAAGVDVRIENGTLTLEARRPSEPRGPALAREYDEVDFARTFRIPAGIDTANITAESKNGTVVVRLPKVAAVKPRKITVQST
jgi:HSP20 family molecular chaperone IbpA